MAGPYYVSAATGNDGDDGLSEGNAWLTIDKAMNEVAAGEKVWVKADGNYTELATIDTAGGAATPIVFEGYTTATGDGGRATITGGAARANCITDSLAGGTDLFYVFKNFRMTDATGSGFNTDCEATTFKNCKFDANGGSGLTGRQVACEGCEFTGNTADGVTLGGSGGGIFIGCTFYSNVNGIAASGLSFTVVGCTFFSNSTYGIAGGGGALAVQAIINCVFDGDGKDTDRGFNCDADTQVTAIVNTVVYDCTTGLRSAADSGDRVISRNNCLNANTADYDNMDTFTGEVTDAPNFVNEAAGADYTPDTGSPLIAAGYDLGSDMDIGAIQVTAGSGGGLLMPNKRGNMQ